MEHSPIHQVRPRTEGERSSSSRQRPGKEEQSGSLGEGTVEDHDDGRPPTAVEERNLRTSWTREKGGGQMIQRTAHNAEPMGLTAAMEVWSPLEAAASASSSSSCAGEEFEPPLQPDGEVHEDAAETEPCSRRREPERPEKAGNKEPAMG